jgi:hypothetical protein
MNSVALRVQRLAPNDQVLVLLYLAQLRGDRARISPADIENLMVELVLPVPFRVSNVLAALEREGRASRSPGRGAVWAVTPEGRQSLSNLDFVGDLRALLAEVASTGASLLGGMVHPLLPSSLAPPELVHGVQGFLTRHPFETNVFGMTRFPSDEDEEDPVRDALTVAAGVCSDHGLFFSLASDRAIADDLWANVSAHMWSGKYGIAFFEDRLDRGVNYNMTIEVGSMLMAGRRCALLKDISITSLPTDLVGKIYKAVDLDDSSTVEGQLHRWCREDLALGSCAKCA